MSEMGDLGGTLVRGRMFFDRGCEMMTRTCSVSREIDTVEG
jgi:hypothetical protein